MRTTVRRRASALAAGALVALALAGCTDDVGGEQIAGVRDAAVLAAPSDRPPGPLEVPVPVLGGDEELRLSSFIGQVVVVNFWGSWCGPCRREQPELNAAAAALDGEPVVFLGVNVDDSEPNALAHEREFEVPYRSVYDPASSYAARFGGLGAAAVPTTLVLDGDGRIALRLIGETDALEVVAAVDRVLRELTEPA